MSGYNNLMGEGVDSRFILAESGKIHDPTTEQIDEEEDEMKETSNLYGNSTSLIVSDRKKIETELSKPPKPSI
jgi:hypothetical protein